MTMLHVFAVNRKSDLRHTNLTRAQGLVADLPPLHHWLGVAEIDTNDIEVFPIEDLGEMPLSDYVTMAFVTALEPDSDTRRRLDALEGSVLLVPETALPDAPKPGSDLTLIATLPLAVPDHSADLPKAPVTPATPEPEDPTPADAKGSRTLSQLVKFVLVAAFFLILLVVVFIVLDGG